MLRIVQSLTFHPILILVGALLCLALASGAVRADPVSITGHVTYRERIALPPNSYLNLKLLDISLASTQTRLQAEAAISGPGQVPFQFSLNFDSNVIVPRHSYALVAEIRSGNTVLFRNAEPYAIDPLAPETSVKILVNLVARQDRAEKAASPDIIPVQPEASEIPSPLLPPELLNNMNWRLTHIGEKITAPDVTTTLTFAEDGRAGGKGGCNSYFTQTAFSDEGIGFGAVASTQMACLPPAMAQEDAYFAALAKVRSFQLEDTTLYLSDAAAKRLLTFAKMP